MSLRAILFDLGDTLIAQRIDDQQSLDQLTLVLLPGAIEALQDCSQRYKLGLVSNTTRSTGAQVAIALQRLGIRRFFTSIVTSCDVGFSKPSPQIFLTALRLLGVSAKETLMVGNNLKEDILGAKALHLYTALYNGSPLEPGADIVFADLSLLPAKIAELDRRLAG